MNQLIVNLAATGGVPARPTTISTPATRPAGAIGPWATWNDAMNAGQLPGTPRPVVDR